MTSPDHRLTHASSSPLLVVESGAHRSAQVAVPCGETSVGSQVENEVVLSDHSAPVGFKLKRDGQALVLSAVDCPIDIAGKVLRPGQVRAVRNSVAFRSGGVSFQLEMRSVAGRTSGAHRWGGRGFVAGVACTAAVVMVAALVGAPSWPPPTELTVLREARSATPAKREQLAAIEQVKPAESSEALLGELRQQIASARLDGIAVSLQPDGAVAATGRIVPAKGEAWHAAVRWFDTAARGGAVLVDRVEISAAAAALQVQAVYTGRVRYVIDGDGEKLFVGSSLPDGSVIQTIESQRVLLKRGDQVVAVRF